MPAATLEVNGLEAGYGQTSVIEGVSFRLAAGSRTALLGRNGMGKTTLLATLMGQTRRRGGTIRLEGQALELQASDARARAGLGYVPQTRDIFASLTVEDNLVVGLQGRPRAALAEAYAMFPRLHERRRHLGSQLSGGEQQMLAIARTLLGQPSVLLLDEPLEGLAPVVCDTLMAALERLGAQRRMTLLLVEQNVERALAFADEVMVLQRGRIVWQGTPAQLRGASDVVERFLGMSVL